MSKKDLTTSSKVLLYLLAADNVLSPWMNPYTAFRSGHLQREKSYKTIIYRLQKRGFLKVVDKNAERFIKLTKNGQLEALFTHSSIPATEKSDGKWRVVMFDIPEAVKDKRSVLRRLLKQSGYHRLQNSVYISPYPINMLAIKFLKQSKLMPYIRIMKVEKMDNDADLRKRFNI